MCVIPARYGSTRLPGKPLLEIAGKPMIQHVVERVRQATAPQRVIVADVHPAWSVLGRQHRAMYDLIAHAGMTRPADIYAAARVSTRSGQLTLSALATAGLIARVGRTVAIGPVSLDDIAAAHHLD